MSFIIFCPFFNSPHTPSKANIFFIFHKLLPSFKCYFILINSPWPPHRILIGYAVMRPCIVDILPALKNEDSYGAQATCA